MLRCRGKKWAVAFLEGWFYLCRAFAWNPSPGYDGVLLIKRFSTTTPAPRGYRRPRWLPRGTVELKFPDRRLPSFARVRRNAARLKN